MVEFGILAATHSPRSMLGAEFQELSSFRVTPFGQPLLEAVRDALRSHGP